MRPSAQDECSDCSKYRPGRANPMSRALLTAVALLLPTLPIFAADPPEAAPLQKVTSVEGITEYKLANGLHLLLFPDPSKPVVTVNMTVLVGSRHEGYGETGMAHLLEHM